MVPEWSSQYIQYKVIYYNLIRGKGRCWKVESCDEYWFLESLMDYACFDYCIPLYFISIL